MVACDHRHHDAGPDPAVTVLAVLLTSARIAADALNMSLTPAVTGSMFTFLWSWSDSVFASTLLEP